MQAVLRERPVLQPEQPQQAMRLEPPLQAAWEQPQEQLQAHFVLEQPEPLREPQVLQPVEPLPTARLALPQEQQASQPH